MNITCRQDQVYESNLIELANAVLHGKHSRRSDIIAQRLRNALLATAENPALPFSADYALRKNYDHTFDTMQRLNPLNSNLSKPVWDYKMNEVQLDFNLDLANPNILAVNVESRKGCQSIEIGSTNCAGALGGLPRPSREVVMTMDRVKCTETFEKKSKIARIENCNNEVQCQRKTMIRQFSESVWNTFAKANRKNPGSPPNKDGDSLPQRNQLSLSSSVLQNALQNISDNDQIFLACSFKDGSTNMDLTSDDANSYATALLIMIVNTKCHADPSQFTYTLSSSCPQQTHDILAIFNNHGIKVAFNFKILFRYLASVVSLPKLFSCLNGTLFDLKIGAWLLNTDISSKELTFDSVTLRMNSKGKGEKPNFALDKFSKTLTKHFSAMWSQYAIMIKIQKQDGYKLADLVNFESRVALVLASMESSGVKVDQEYLRIQLSRVKEKLEYLEQRSYEYAGHSFNLASPEQVGRVLFDELGLSGCTKLESGHRSTAEPVLASLKAFHALPGVISLHRTLSKLASSYIEPLLSASKGKQGIIHTNWNQCSCATGRLSSSGPNLQSLPKCISKPNPSDETEMYVAGVRNAFVCDPEDILVTADYKQMEIRVFAMLSQDRNLNNAIANSVDLYQNLGAIIFSKSPSAIDGFEKAQAKTIFLAMMYGMGVKSLSNKLSYMTKSEITYADALNFNSKIASQFPEIQKYVSATILFCREHGFVETITGRRRYLPDITSTDQAKRRQTERQAVNSVIQGSSSDIMKCAMLKLMSLFEKHSLAASTNIRLQIHDELVVSCRNSNLELVCKLIADAMQDNALSQKFKGRFQVSIKAGKNLNDLVANDSWE